MKKHTCTCQILPPYVVDILVDKKIVRKKDFQTTIKVSKELRDRRKNVSMQMKAVAGLVGPMGKGERFIYDSKHTSKGHFVQVRTEADGPVADPAANDVFDNCGKVRDFYKNTYNWFSVDNNGKSLVMNIHYQENFNNALWSSDVDQMFFGDGDGSTLVNLTGALDVIGHELTHGVVEYTAALEYQGQSGALNEHIADVFGTVIKQFYGGQNAAQADWLIGDKVVGTSFPGKAIRSLKDPGKAFTGDPQPDNMADLYTGTNDNGGVHINSGILNKAFYLVAAGLPGGHAGLDTPLAGQLWFETLKAIKDPTCDFKTFFSLILSTAAAPSLAGKLPITGADLIKGAFAAVGIQ
jgi:Zn-dependent metalloprotease